MSQINPFIGSIVQTPQVQRQQSVERDRQIRQVAEATKATGVTGDQTEHQVESSEELKAIHEDSGHERRFKRPRHGKAGPNESEDTEDGEPHIDLTA